MMTNELLKAWLECLKRDLRCECCINDECEHCDLLKKQGTLKERIDALDKVIKALEQQPCEDCISSTDLIAAMHLIMDDAKIGDNDEDYESLDDIKEQYIEIVKGMVSVKPEVKWIPVSERTPEGGQDVLFCDIDGDIMIGYHVRGRLDTRFSQQGTYEDIKNVRAWMPLPESYKVESEENNDDD